MPRLPEISEPFKPWEKPVPLWLKLDEGTKKALAKYQRRRYHTELNPPNSPADILAFDPSKEMGAPKSETHMRPT